VIVNWNTHEELLRCISHLLRSEVPGGVEVVVVDNASQDGSADAVAAEFGESVRLLRNSENRYYAAANNQGFAEARGDCVLIVNPDVYVAPDTAATLARLLDAHPEAAACAPQLVLPDGSVQRSCRRFPRPWWLACEALGLRRVLPRTRSFGGYLYGEWGHDSERTVDQPMTSCLMVRKADLDRCGGFDESFPMFFNDVDLCYRLAQAGRLVLFTPSCPCRHDHGASTRQVRAAMVRESTRGLLRFYEKHYASVMPRWAYAVCRGLIRLGGGVRGFLADRAERSLGSARTRS
jgi:hypothetical protein